MGTVRRHQPNSTPVPYHPLHHINTTPTSWVTKSIRRRRRSQRSQRQEKKKLQHLNLKLQLSQNQNLNLKQPHLLRNLLLPLWLRNQQLQHMQTTQLMGMRVYHPHLPSRSQSSTYTGTGRRLSSTTTTSTMVRTTTARWYASWRLAVISLSGELLPTGPSG